MSPVLNTNPQTNSALFKRGTFLRWLRKTHGFLGLWGAGLGLLFGATGILLNHRSVMKLPLAQYEKSNIELQLPAIGISNPELLSHWLQGELHLAKSASKVEAEPSKKVTWNGLPVQQPAVWKVDFHTAQYSVTTEYWVGNQFVSVKRQEANVFAFLSRLHKGIGMSNGWILLVDSLAGALIMLCMTGILLWTKMRNSRLMLVGLSGGSILLATMFVIQSS
ncbi:MAG: PepSY-associated TM helix domain-containing protein [Methylophilaceae bacterium]